MRKYNHAFDFAVEVISNREDREDVTAAQLRAALIKRANTLSDDEILEACGCYDTHEEPGVIEDFVIEIRAIRDDETAPEHLDMEADYLVSALDVDDAHEILDLNKIITDPECFDIVVRFATEDDTPETVKGVLTRPAEPKTA